MATETRHPTSPPHNFKPKGRQRGESFSRRGRDGAAASLLGRGGETSSQVASGVGVESGAKGYRWGSRRRVGSASTGVAGGAVGGAPAGGTGEGAGNLARLVLGNEGNSG